jgi:chromosome segregation ATPase
MSKKEAMIQKAEARRAQIDAEVQRLKAKVDEAEADYRLHLERQLEELRGHRAELESTASRIREAADDALNDISDGFERAWATMSESLRKAKSRFK